MMRNSRAPRLLNQSKADDIIDLAEEVSLRRFPDRRVDPIAIAKSQKITLSFGHYQNAFDGMLEHSAGRFHIYVNLDRVEQRDSRRARFTVAHELGHYYIDEHRNALKAGLAPAHLSSCEYESKNPIEREADLFASCLLMPAARFCKEGVKHQTGLLAILRLADLFGTSVTSTAIRYATLNIRPCAVVKWNDGKFGWKWLSTDTFQARLFRTIQAVEDLPVDSPTVRVLGGEQSAKGFVEAGTTVAAWFAAVADNGYRNAILIEQAMQLGRFGVLTFLYPYTGSYQADI